MARALDTIYVGLYKFTPRVQQICEHIQRNTKVANQMTLIAPRPIYTDKKQKKLPQRNSTSATHVILNSIANSACNSPNTAAVVQLGLYRLQLKSYRHQGWKKTQFKKMQVFSFFIGFKGFHDCLGFLDFSVQIRLDTKFPHRKNILYIISVSEHFL